MSLGFFYMFNLLECGWRYAFLSEAGIFSEKPMIAGVEFVDRRYRFEGNSQKK